MRHEKKFSKRSSNIVKKRKEMSIVFKLFQKTCFLKKLVKRFCARDSIWQSAVNDSTKSRQKYDTIRSQARARARRVCVNPWRHLIHNLIPHVSLFYSWNPACLAFCLSTLSKGNFPLRSLCLRGRSELWISAAWALRASKQCKLRPRV